MSAIGTTLGAPVGGAMIAWLGWRSVFLVNLPIGIAALALVLRTLPSRSAASGPIDSARAADGAADERLSLGSAYLRRSLAMSAAISAVIMTTLVVGPFYLSRELQLEPARVGLVMAVGPMIAALAGVPSGRLVERIGAPRATTAGLIVIASGCFALSALPSSVGLAGYLAPIALVTSGYALFQTANVTGVMTRIPAAHRGAAAGWLSLSRYAGLSAGTWLMGAVYALASSVTGDAAAGMRATFAVGVTLVGAALALSTTHTTTHNQ
jgi:predicted MFS family arabinose efflux permease